MDKELEFRETEDVLRRLMPSGGREEFYEETGELLEGLELEVASGWKRFAGGVVSAAALVLVGLLLFLNYGEEEVGVSDNVAGISKVLRDTEYLAAADDKGFFSDNNGNVVRRLNFSVVGERKMRDQETGIVFTVLEPREEAFLLTVNQF